MSNQPTLSQPNRWCREQLWRYPFPRDRARARQVRQALRQMGLYAEYDLATNVNLAAWEANSRAALPAMLAELDRTDLIAVATLARLLALVPRRPHFFKMRRRRRRSPTPPHSPTPRSSSR